MNILETQNLSYKYEDGTLALNRVSIGVEKGLTTAIIGGNGSGKSTLFLNLNGIFKPFEGEVIFDGKTIKHSKKDLQMLRQQVGIVFQNSDEQLFSANVKKDIAFGLKNMGLSDEEAEKRLSEVIEKTGIKEIINKPTHALSFGQKKRVAIAGVLAMQPSVIILDEPTAGLDPQGVSEILELIEELKQTHGITVILSTHEIDLIPLYCDRVYVLDRGEVEFFGTPEQLCMNSDVLRKHNLRLPRIAHLMEILNKKDNIGVDLTVSTISGAREEVKRLVRENNG